VRLLVFLTVSMAPLLAFAADSDPPKITHEKAERAEPGKDFDVEAVIEDPSGVFDPVVVYRLGEGGFERLSMTEAGEGVYIATVPVSANPTATSVEYFVEAYDQEGNGPARVGSEAELLSVPIEAPPPIEPVGEGEGEGEVGNVDVREPPPIEDNEGGSGAGLWIGVGVGTAVVALAAGGVSAWYFLLREDIPESVRVNIGAPSPVTGATQ
jgi:hypothetical protein